MAKAQATSAATARIELRTTPEVKELLKSAAARERVDLTTFILRYAVSAADDVMAGRRHRIILSERDAEFVLDLLDNPPPPPPALIEAAKRRREREARESGG